MTAIQIVSNLDIGGGQEVVRTLARYLPLVGCTPVVVALRDGPMRTEIERLGLQVELVRGRRRSLLALPLAIAELIRIRRDLARIAHRHRPAIVQTHLLRALDFLVLTLRWDRSVEGVFWTIHNARLDLRADQLPGQRWLLAPKRVAHRLLYRAGARMVDGIIAVSDDVAAEIRRRFRPPAGRVTVIPNGIDVARFAIKVDRRNVRRSIGVPAAARLLIVVATLHEQKGHAVLLESLEAVMREVPELHVIFVGDGPLRQSLEARAAASSASARIHFLGNRPDVPELLQASDLFVLPSLWEGLPMALLEAMGAGLATIATDVSGSRDVVLHGKTGLLVPPASSAALEAAMIELLANRSVARAMGQAGRRRVADRFSGTVLAERHVALYRARSRSTEH